jgi:hypothetical protein
MSEARQQVCVDRLHDPPQSTTLGASSEASAGKPDDVPESCGVPLEPELLAPDADPELDDAPELPIPESSLSAPPRGFPLLLLPQADEATTQANAPLAKRPLHQAINRECIELSARDRELGMLSR